MQIFPIADAFQFAQTAAPLAITALWQGAAVAAALSLCLRLAPRVSAAHRFAAWAAGFAVVAALPLLPLLSHLTFAAGPVGTPALTQPAGHSGLMLDARWGLAVAGLWIAASALRAAQLAANSLRLRRLWKSATPIESDIVASLAGLSGVARVTIYTTRQLDRPSVIGFFAPRILIPGWLFARLTHEDLEQVVLHEAEHLRRRDDWTNLLQKLALVVFPLNPALAFIERRLCSEREMACDEAVVRRTRAPRAYAACLASLAERGLEHRAEALTLGAWQRRPELVRRVHSILRGSTNLSPIAGPTLLAAVSCGLIFGSIELVRCPQMVAFLPVETAPAAFQAPANPTHRVESPQLLPASFSPASGSSGLRAVRAVNVNAALPATGPAIAINAGQHAVGSSQSTRFRQVKSSTLASSMPREQLLKAEMNSTLTRSAGQPQQWFVFTTWQQIETPATSAEIADYDTSADASAAPQANMGRPADARSITVTRMIFSIYPVAAMTGPAHGSESGSHPVLNSSSKSVSHQRAAVPFGDGWLVIQL